MVTHSSVNRVSWKSRDTNPVWILESFDHMFRISIQQTKKNTFNTNNSTQMCLQKEKQVYSPHDQAISTELSLDHVAFAALCAMTKRVLPVKHIYTKH